MTAPSSDSAAIRQVVRALKAGGWALDGVFGHEDYHVPVQTEAEVIEAVMAVDDATLAVRGFGTTGWVYFVLGNEPDEVVCNHTVNLSPVLDPLMEGWDQ